MMHAFRRALAFLAVSLTVMGIWTAAAADTLYSDALTIAPKATAAPEPRPEDAPLPENVSVDILSRIERRGAEPAYGDVVTLTAVVSGTEGYETALQWEYRRDGQWLCAEGETSLSISFALSEQSAGTEWRLRVLVLGAAE